MTDESAMHQNEEYGTRVEKWQQALGELVDLPGSVLYSSHHTLKTGQVMIMGVNPGGVGGESIASNLSKLPRRTDNAYLDEDWRNGLGGFDRGLAPLQRRIKSVAEMLGVDLRDCCATNLIFTQSRSVRGLNVRALAEKCWPVHEELFQMVAPKAVIAFGNGSGSPYEFLRNRLGGQNEEVTNSGHGNWKLRSCVVQAPYGGQLQILGFPHLSRFDPNRDEVRSWLKGARARLEAAG